MKKIFFKLYLIFGFLISVLSFAEESIAGFKLNKIEKNSIYDKLGFKVGDVIKSCNGKLLKTPEDAKVLYKLITTSNKLNFTIERNGKIENLHFDIK